MKHILAFILFCVGLSSFVNGESSISREKRHFAELKTTDYATRIALQRQLSRCLQIGCGLVDIIASGKKKRDTPMIGEYSDDFKNYLLSKILESSKPIS